MRKISGGFTIIELLVVLVILSSFAFIGITGMGRLKDNALNEKNQINAEAFASALDEIYKSGSTSQGVRGERGIYLDVKTACSDPSNTVFEQILQKHTNLEQDTQIVTIDRDPFIHSSSWDADWAGNTNLPDNRHNPARIESDGSVVAKSNATARLFSCSSTKDMLGFEELTKKNTILYLPIARYKPADHCAPGVGNCPNAQIATSNCFDTSNIADASINLDCTGFKVYYLVKNGSDYFISPSIYNRP